MEELAIARHREQHDPLLVGRRLRCPRCGNEDDLLAYFVFDRPEAHADELNVVLKCRAKVRNPRTGKGESCRCVFSVGDPLSVVFAAHANQQPEAEHAHAC